MFIDSIFLSQRLSAKVYTVYLVIKPNKHTPLIFFRKRFCMHKGFPFIYLIFKPNTCIVQKYFKQIFSSIKYLPMKSVTFSELKIENEVDPV